MRDNHKEEIAMRVVKLATTAIVAIALCAGWTSGATAQPIKIGITAALTGPGAVWGMATQYGAKILADEINAQGGLEVAGKKHQVEIIAYDDQYKPAETVAVYSRLVNSDGVKFIIIMSAAGSVAIQQSIEADQVIGITASYAPGAIDPKSKYMFSMYSTPVDYVPSFVDWMKNNLKERRIAIINPNDESGWGTTKLTEGVYQAGGFTVLERQLFERSTKEFAPLLTRLLALNPEIIDLSSIVPATAGLIVRQARELGYKGRFVKTGGAGPKDVVAAAGKEAAEGMLNMLYADPANQGYQRLVAAYHKQIGQDPNEIIVPFYDVTNVVLHAIQKAGTINDTAKIAAAFSQALPMKSVQGDEMRFGGMHAFGIDRQVLTVNYIGEIRNGEPVIVGRTK
jgi:branched-chain amino acid transport system substrate-binding protein